MNEATKLRRPCSNCPWRVDAPRDHWDPQHFVDIWRNCQDDSMHIMLCHKSSALPKEERGDLPCQGWIRVLGLDAIGVRLLVWDDRVTLEELEDRDGPELFPTFAAMMSANNIPLPERSRHGVLDMRIDRLKVARRVPRARGSREKRRR